MSADLADPRHVCGLELVHDRRSRLSCCGHPSLLDRSSLIVFVHLGVSPGQLTRRLLEVNRAEMKVCVYMSMYKLYLMTVKTWLQSNLPHGHLVSKS